MKKFLLLPFIFVCLSVQWSMAQAPKWVEKAKRAVFSVVIYDKNDKILNTGNGFFVTEDGWRCLIIPCSRERNAPLLLIRKESKCRWMPFWERMICTMSSSSG